MSDGLVLVRADGEKATRHLVRPEMVIGSGRGSGLRLRDSGVNRRHAVIEHFSSGLAIRSLNSRAEVLINGEPVSLRTLRPGDRVSIGPAQFDVQETVWEDDGQEGTPSRPMPSPRDIPEDPVPAEVLARVRKPETAPPLFSGPPMQRRRSVATHGTATLICLLIVLADAIALGWYIEGI